MLTTRSNFLIKLLYSIYSYYFYFNPKTGLSCENFLLIAKNLLFIIRLKIPKSFLVQSFLLKPTNLRYFYSSNYNISKASLYSILITKIKIPYDSFYLPTCRNIFPF